MCSREKAIENAVASVEMEEFQVDEETRMMCERLLKGEITYDEYLTFTLKSVMVTCTAPNCADSTKSAPKVEY